MPELPDLQVFSRNLNKKLAGKKIKELRLVNKSKLKIPATHFKKAIEGTTLKKVYREGKELHFAFSNGNVIGMHLMLHGQLHYFEGKNDKKYAIVEMIFADQTGLALSDYQKAANATLNPEEKEAPDALSKEVNTKFLQATLSKKKTNLKNFLLDQKNIRGVGNAYADEILWKAGISPFSICNKIPSDKIKLLANAIKAVLKNAEKQIIKKNPEIISGEVRDFLDIHNSKKKKSPKGKTIRNKMLNARITYYTDEQKLFK
jgi:formamidopyrimidine-DNA glycosylase